MQGESAVPDGWVPYAGFTADDSAPKTEAEWILENINEWRRGCGNTDGGHPYDCKECTVALIDVIERRAKRIAGSDKE